MNVLNLNYANMIREAKEELDKIWIPNVGDFAIDEKGMIGVLVNNTKQTQITNQKFGVDEGTTSEVYVGVTLLHNGLPWFSENPIWMPRLDQIITFFGGMPDAIDFITQFNRWLVAKDADYTFSANFAETVELAFAMYMDIVYNKKWDFVNKKWESIA